MPRFFFSTGALPVLAQNGTEGFKNDIGDIHVVFPGDEDYVSVSAAFNQRFEVHPFAVTFPTNTEQVSTVVQAGAKYNLGVVARSGGHSYIANGLGGTSSSSTVVVDLSQMKNITIDPSTFKARIETGNRLGDVALALNEKGRGLPHGRCSYVGIGGHSGFGGWGFASRMWGLTLDNILSATLVLANGTIAEVSEDSHSELFWGIRGSAPSFSITTSILFKTHPVPPSGGMMFQFLWDVPTSNATQALKAYQSWALDPQLPSNIGADFGVIKGSATGRVGVILFGIYFSSIPGQTLLEVETEANQTLASFLSQSGLPSPDTTISSLGSNVFSGSWIDVLSSAALPTDVLNTTAGGHDGNDTFYAKSIMVPEEEPLTEGAVEGMMEYLGTNGFESDLFWAIEIDLYGGPHSALHDVPPDATAFAHRDTLMTFQIYIASNDRLPPFPDEGLAFADDIASSVTSNMPDDWNYGCVAKALLCFIRRFLALLHDLLAHFSKLLNSAYPNYLDDRLPDWQHRYYGSHYPRLEALKASVDPEDVFRFPLSVE
ncbi:hypothetical protein D9758_018936 [Tetrapyrgos nigripes]|uniref:FAD-binding PCMH-type domain-containing protein n=1 Tax=Tetrapyrgos nigripes TaxID=182062 RepID=A0A8H5B612_9AGAR|nr:hypothetical protein D9758_018936 [Tetrapyrgos nigripes]